jgi:hypothetical protein
MATALPNNFRELLTAMDDPWENDAGGLLQAFRADAPPNGPSPADCFAICEASTYPTWYLASNQEDHCPMVIGAAYNTDMVGRADNTLAKWVLCGDLTPEGAMPPVTMLAQASFRLTGNSTVPLRPDFVAGFAALPPGSTHLPAAAAGNGTEEVRTRKVMPIPHPFVPMLLEAHARGELTFPWLAAHVVSPLILDGALLHHYAPFVDYIRVAATMRPGAAENDPDRYPECEMSYVGTLNPRAQQYLTQSVRRYIAATGPALGLGAQLNAMASQMAQVSTTVVQTVANAHIKPVKTVQEWNGPLFQNWCKVTEVASEHELSALCRSLPILPRNGHHGAIEMALLNNATRKGLTLAVVDPAFTADIIQGRWVASNNSQIDQGLAITRIHTELSGQAVVQAQLNRNRAFVVLGAFQGGGDSQALSMVLNSQAAALAANSTQLRGVVEAFYNVLSTLFEKHDGTINSLLLCTYKEELIDKMNLIVAHLERDFPEAAEKRAVIVRILIFIFRITNEELHKRLSGPMLLPGAVLPPRTPPPYKEVLEHLQRGRAQQLTDIPPSLGQLIRPSGHTPTVLPVPALPRTIPTSSQPQTQAPPRQGSSPSSAGQRTQVENLHQNPELKHAWAAIGQASIFGVGSAFRDETQRGNKRVVMRPSGQGRICLPMCLRGVCFSNCTGYHGILSPEEVRLVAQAGGLQVDGL